MKRFVRKYKPLNKKILNIIYRLLTIIFKYTNTKQRTNKKMIDYRQRISYMESKYHIFYKKKEEINYILTINMFTLYFHPYY